LEKGGGLPLAGKGLPDLYCSKERRTEFGMWSLEKKGGRAPCPAL